MLLGSEFLSILLIIIYVGAIAVLFLFVIMMLNTRFVEVYNIWVVYLSVICFILLMFIFEIFIIFYFNLNTIFVYLSNFELKYYVWVFYYNNFLDIKLLGNLLINYYNYFILIAGIILLLALIGSVLLTYNKINKVNNFNITKSIKYLFKL